MTALLLRAPRCGCVQQALLRMIRARQGQAVEVKGGKGVDFNV